MGPQNRTRDFAYIPFLTSSLTGGKGPTLCNVINAIIIKTGGALWWSTA